MAEDETLEKLIAETMAKKESENFTSLYDKGFKSSDREVFDAAKALAYDFNQDKSLRKLESEAEQNLGSLDSLLSDYPTADKTDEEIQRLSNEALLDSEPVESSAVKLDLSSYPKPSEKPYVQNTENMNKTTYKVISANNRPAGHPVNRQRPNTDTSRTTSRGAASSQKRRAGAEAAAPCARSKSYDDYDDYDEPKSRKSKDKDKGGKGGKKKKKHVLRKIIISLLLIVLILFGLVSLLIFKYINMMNLVETGTRASLSVVPEDESYVKNILIIGSDTRNEESGRSDTMILVSINSKTKQIVQTSFMRDTLVNIPGYGQAKLNAAYAYGGAELVMDTIEENFEIKVDKYVRIDFFSFVDIIDAVDGLRLTVDDSEAAAMTDPMNEINDILGRASGTGNLSSGGTYDMDGVQALAYARIRYAGDGDFDRTGRQREVIEKLIEKFKSLGLLEMNDALKTILPEITTNLGKSEIYFMCLKLVFYSGYEMKQFRVPYGEQGEGYWSYGYLGSQSVLEIDFDKNIELLKQVIFEGKDVDVN